MLSSRKEVIIDGFKVVTSYIKRLFVPSNENETNMESSKVPHYFRWRTDLNAVPKTEQQASNSTSKGSFNTHDSNYLYL